MSATELRQAAETLRERAGNANCKCGSSACTPERGWFGPGEALERLDSAGAANYVSVMTPAVGLALADLLDFAAETAQGWERIGNLDPSNWPEPTRLAHILARALLGGAS